jgi:hypothetical protein
VSRFRTGPSGWRLALIDSGHGIVDALAAMKYALAH